MMKQKIGKTDLDGQSLLVGLVAQSDGNHYRF
jgi:hypothetical protein